MSKFAKQLALEEAFKLDVASSTVTYLGNAPPGSATSAAVWKIKRMTQAASGDIDIEWADLGRNTQIWDNRASLTYT
jgi:hypothetical protein